MIKRHPTHDATYRSVCPMNQDQLLRLLPDQRPWKRGLSTRFDPGFLKIPPRTITNWDSDLKPHGNLTFTQGMQLSSNVVLAQVGRKLGKDSFYTYLKAFGFGSKTGVDISGEESGLLLPQDKVRDLALATMSFGQVNSVTPT